MTDNRDLYSLALFFSIVVASPFSLAMSNVVWMESDERKDLEEMRQYRLASAMVCLVWAER